MEPLFDNLKFIQSQFPETDKESRKVTEMLERARVNLANISFIIHKTNRSWMRDSGPIIVKNGSKREALNFHFNGWAKYKNYKLDRQVPSTVANHLKIPLIPVFRETSALLTARLCKYNPSLVIHKCVLKTMNYS